MTLPSLPLSSLLGRACLQMLNAPEPRIMREEWWEGLGLFAQTEATSCPCAPKREPCAQLQGITQRFTFCARSSSGQYNAKAGSHLVCTSLGCFSFNSSLWLVLRTFFFKKRKKKRNKRMLAQLPVHKERLSASATQSPISVGFEDSSSDFSCSCFMY